MSILGTLKEQASARGIEFIVCGGYAVNAYQVIRKTGDVDLVVCARDAEAWKAALFGLGYTLSEHSDAFLQFHPPAVSAWPVDLILVEDATFGRLKAEAQEFRFGDTVCWIPSLQHLIAMKLHALKHTGERRMRKDAIDIVELAELHGIDLCGEEFREQCARFADSRVYERILVYAGKPAAT